MRGASNRLWTLILALSLVAGGTVALPGHVRADAVPGETSPPPGSDPNEGDPDFPDGKSSAPRTGPPRGVGNPAVRTMLPDRMGPTGKWMWSFRVAVSTVYRMFFRF